MNQYGMNGHDLELARFETPFADVQEKEDRTEEASIDNFYNNYLLEVESPFRKTFETATTPEGLNSNAEQFVELLAELHDTDFEDSLYELATEAEDSWSNKISNEAAMGSNYIPFATKHARDYFEPVAQEAEAMIDRAAEHFSANNLADYSDKEIESFFDQLPLYSTRFSPAQEQFLGGIFKKVKKLVKKGVNLAKKGVQAVGKILPVNMLLGKFRGMIRPLLEKVLQYALGKLPKNLQPYAQTLAKKFLNLNVTVETPAVDQPAPSDAGTGGTEEPTENVDAVQTDLDTHVAQLVFAPDEQEADMIVNEYSTSFQTVDRLNNYESAGVDVPSLNEARQQLVDELKSLQPGENPAPAIERFLPAAIMALQPAIKIAISLIGRQKVVNFLANLLTKLIGNYVPANVVQPLATNIIDVGMSAIGFETYEMQRPDVGYEAIANTIVETVQNMNELNEAVVNDQEALTMHLLEAFEAAAANNFPAQYIREELRQTKKGGTWVMMPRNGPKHYYKKFTHVFDTTIDPPTAASVTTFRGLPLANFLKDKLGLDPSKPIQAKVHLFEAIKGTRLSRISKHENLPGFNAKQPFAWVQLHPLTAQASSALLKEPAIGKDFDERYFKNRRKTHPGYRYYYLEINGARLRIPPKILSKIQPNEGIGATVSRPSQSGDIQAVLNFVKSEIKLNYYISEEDAKNIVEKLNRSDFLGVAQGIRQAVKNVLNEMLSKNISSKVKIVHEAFPELFLEHYEDRVEQFSLDSLGSLVGKGTIKTLVDKLIEKVSDLAYQSLGNYFKARATEFKAAQAEPQDGVTITISWKNVQGMAAIRSVISAIRGEQLSVNNLTNLSLPSFNAPEIEIKADKKFD